MVFVVAIGLIYVFEVVSYLKRLLTLFIKTSKKISQLENLLLYYSTPANAKTSGTDWFGKLIPLNNVKLSLIYFTLEQAGWCNVALYIC